MQELRSSVNKPTCIHSARFKRYPCVIQICPMTWLMYFAVCFEETKCSAVQKVSEMMEGYLHTTHKVLQLALL